MSSHRSPSDVRSGLKHPIIDADGHWVEYNPVFAERMRKLADHIRQAHEGCDFDFLKTGFGEPVGEPAIY